jgi:outer membrane lipoprotein SlyB
MRITRSILLSTVTAAFLAGCVTQPTGPTIPVMPGPNKSLEVFQQDETTCENYASQRVAGGAEAANNKAITEGILGTALGAGLGAAIGGGRGAAIGAASGAVVGTAVGSNTSNWSQMSLQQRYDFSYAQCMKTKGDQVPGMGRPHPWHNPPPGYGPPPPPPPGYGPPPPPPPPGN